MPGYRDQSASGIGDVYGGLTDVDNANLRMRMQNGDLAARLALANIGSRTQLQTTSMQQEGETARMGTAEGRWGHDTEMEGMRGNTLRDVAGINTRPQLLQAETEANQYADKAPGIRARSAFEGQRYKTAGDFLTQLTAGNTGPTEGGASGATPQTPAATAGPPSRYSGLPAAQASDPEQTRMRNMIMMGMLAPNVPIDPNTFGRSPAELADMTFRAQLRAAQQAKTIDRIQGGEMEPDPNNPGQYLETPAGAQMRQTRQSSIVGGALGSQDATAAGLYATAQNDITAPFRENPGNSTPLEMATLPGLLHQGIKALGIGSAKAGANRQTAISTARNMANGLKTRVPDPAIRAQYVQQILDKITQTSAGRWTDPDEAETLKAITAALQKAL